MKALKIFFILVILSLSGSLLAQVKVEMVRGDVKYNGKFLKTRQVISEKGMILVGDKSLCKIKFEKTGSVLVIGPNSSMALRRPKTTGAPLLKTGAVRFYSLLKDDNGKKPTVYTKQMAAGIRGTDFLLKVNPLLGESEIVMFDGIVELTNLAKTKDKLTVKKGQWGGVGGRFGATFQKPIDLPKNVIDVFENVIGR